MSEMARADAIEERLAHQERAIEDLNAVLTDQWKLIDRLSRRLERLEGEFADMETAVRDAGIAEPKPPHY